MDWVAKVIEQLKDASVKRILVLAICAGLILSIWKIEPILEYYKTLHQSSKTDKAENVSKPTVTEDLAHTTTFEVPAELKEKIKSQYLSIQKDVPKNIFLIAVYKFLPGQHDYEYQGRLLVMLDLPQIFNEDQTLTAKELDMNWVPIWSGKEVVELLLEKKTVISKLEDTEGKFYLEDKINLDRMPSLNKEAIINYGVKQIIRYPIVRNDRTVGYILVHLTTNSDEEANEAKKFASLLSGKINYVF